MANHAGKARLPKPSRWPTATQLLVAGLGSVASSLMVPHPPHGGRAYVAAVAFLAAVAGTTLFVLVSGWNADRDPDPLVPALIFVASGAIVAWYSGRGSAGQALAVAQGRDGPEGLRPGTLRGTTASEEGGYGPRGRVRPGRTTCRARR
jgi:hypothetical protein